ncbi:MAG: class I SAM-dependent methyltransferase [Nevskiales bacterium]
MTDSAISTTFDNAGFAAIPRIGALDAGKLAARLGRALRAFMARRVQGIEWGELVVHDRYGVMTLGRAGTGPRVQLTVHHPAFYAYAAVGGSVGAGQAYFLGLWDCDHLTDLVRIFVRNRDTLNAMDASLSRLTAWLHKWIHRKRDNTLSGSRANIAAHYDVGNAFFEQFLDTSMMYSSAIFLQTDASLTEAQTAKLDIICRKLNLGPQDRVIEIGTGWGGFALHAAQHYGAQVTTTTISHQQYEYARDRVAAAGLQSRITLLDQDYRNLKGAAFRGRFNKLVSIEMIEAVGHEHFATFFRKCSELLTPDGQALIQAITIQDRYYEQMRHSVDFIQRYIFPGGCLPSVSAMLDAARRSTDLQLAQLEDYSAHYAATLQQWRQRLLHNLAKVRSLGYTDQFVRMWVYYLCYCEGGFLERQIGVSHLLFNKPLHRGAPLPLRA